MTLVIITAAILAMVVSLRLLGRRWWCKCGGWNLWSSDVTGSHNSNHFADAYSGTHILHGILLYPLAWILGVPPEYRLVAVCAAEAIWETFENTNTVIEFYRRETISRGYTGDSIVNSIGDVLCCLAGAVIAAQAHVWTSVVLVVGIEVLLLATIGDSLTINVYKGIRATVAWARG